MAPSLNHPPGMNFVDDPQHEQRPINADASVYYGTEYHSRARTYSTVRRVCRHITFPFVFDLHCSQKAMPPSVRCSKTIGTSSLAECPTPRRAAPPHGDSSYM